MLIPFFGVSITLAIATPVLLANALRRRFTPPWYLFCVGILTFIGSQAVHLPLNDLLADLGVLPRSGGISSARLWQMSVVLGLSAGLCEELARAIGYALLKRRRTLYDGVMLGLGHGGFEAMVIGGVLTAAGVSALLPLAGKDLSQLGLPREQIAALETQLQMLTTSPWSAFLPLVERLLAMIFHIVLSLLILKAFVNRNPGFVALAIIYHAGVDAGLVYLGQVWQNPWTIQGILAIVLIPGALWATYRLRSEMTGAGLVPEPVCLDLMIFWAALHKELLQQWRTRRILVSAAVLGSFGMLSPLLAYFTPQLLRAIPGAEQFSALVPPPTVADAMTQYIKNLSQFGFILAILLGMSAVAGEKESGTASLILSKPMRRGAFLVSKFTAQMVNFLVGLALGFAGAVFYTTILFGEGHLEEYAAITLLLYVWLLPYVAITLVGSVLASSTSAAGGFALIGAVGLLVSTNIPGLRELMPGALVGWAAKIGSAGPVPGFNGGALAAAVAITLIGLITALAVFEKQEV